VKEQFFNCPYCWEKISMLIDTSISSQIYIEDCETCCNPIQLSYTSLSGEVISFDAISIEQ
tara:strand:+ start:200 stop:382 length:183 start_codon:yes stop_codon:yes gene_type:complete